MEMNKFSVAIVLMTSIIARIESTATANEENDIANHDEPSLGFEGNNTFSQGNEGRCDVLYGDKCYILIVTGGMTLGKAESTCKAAKGKLANIYSEEHFHLIRALLRSRIPMNSDYINVWLGMTLDLSTRRVKLSNGDWVPYTRWYPKRPFEEPRPYVGMRCYHLNDSHQGYVDNWASTAFMGALCEAKVPWTQ